MSTLQEIESAIEGLPRKEVFALGEWLQERIEHEWDTQFERDVKGGRLAAAAQKAIAEHRSGRSRDFPGDEE